MLKMPDWPMVLNKDRIYLGLDRIRSILDVLGNPQLRIPPVIHITGTNGKGSTLSFISSILEHSGYKVHTYTSPHLIYFNERIRLAGTYISDAEIKELSAICKLADDKLDEKVTFFEGITAMAFLAFSRYKADFTLLEVGMGGRLDATNVIDDKLASVITPISYDHTEQLGNSLASIAIEKCGILKPNSNNIISIQTEEANIAINNYANSINAKLYEYDYDFGSKYTKDNFSYIDHNGEVLFPLPSLIGEHQIVNATTAIATVKKTNIKNITDDNIRKALINTNWQGRLERINKGYIANKLKYLWELWIDGAHNDSGAQILANWCRDSELPIYLICGMTRGRNSNRFLEYFTDIANYIIGVRVENETMSYNGEYISNAAKSLNFRSHYLDSFEEAIDFYLANLKPGKIVICGSLYLAGEVIAANNRNY